MHTYSELHMSCQRKSDTRLFVYHTLQVASGKRRIILHNRVLRETKVVSKAVKWSCDIQSDNRQPPVSIHLNTLTGQRWVWSTLLE